MFGKASGWFYLNHMGYKEEKTEENEAEENSFI